MKIRYVLVFFLLLIISYALLVLSSSYILRSEHLNKMRLIVQMIAPPRDLYKYLIKEEFDLTKRGLTKSFQYHNKYLGNHEVGILLDKFSDDLYFKSPPYRLKSKIKIDFYLKNKLVLSRIVEDKSAPFKGARGSGFNLMYYKCPVDLPLDDTIVCEITIIEPDVYLSKKYGPVKIFISKMSDA